MVQRVVTEENEMAKRKWMICPACRGEGSCVNPAIDCNGLTAEDFYDDPDFYDAYMGGVYDEPCAACHGSGKITGERREELAENAADRRLAAMEDGLDPSGLNDFRWG
jgi:DnaJ-class molecular chaperone